MKRMRLIMALHSHQPVGNFDEVFRHAADTCYRPVVTTLSRYPEFRCGLHFSGPLINWLEANQPDLLDLVAAMAERGQVEVLTGGYYEPLLATIPKRDALAQVRKMTDFVTRRFGRAPKGLWLAERVWEPGLPAKLGELGLGYTIVDDTHLYYAGLSNEDMFGYHLTEREGHPLAVFPTHKDLRYTIPFREPGETLDFLKRVMDQHGPTAAVYGDDSEKFGLWPGTWEWVFDKGWLTRFIRAVLKNDAWLATDTPGDYMDRQPATGRVYLPTASYEEMSAWALPARAGRELEDIWKRLKNEGRYEFMRRYVRGGFWDNFLVKYPESNLMHKRATHLSDRLAAQNAPAEAVDHLHQAQCNCAYWHGLFGGLYLGHLRHAVHEHLIAADELADRAAQGDGPWARAEVRDLDRDGRDEVLLTTPELDCAVHPGYGGSLSWLSLRRARFNPTTVLTRRPESYHRFLWEDETELHEDAGEVKSIHDMVAFKEENLRDKLVYDWYERRLFQEHLLAPAATPEAYSRPDYGEWGDLINQPWELTDSGSHEGRAWCEMRRTSRLWAPGGEFPLTAVKRYILEGGRLDCLLTLDLAAADTPACRLAWELNLTLLSPDSDARALVMDGEDLTWAKPWQMTGCDAFGLEARDLGFGLDLRAAAPGELWHYPVETVSNSESGLERTWQGSSLSLVWPVPAGRGRHEFQVTLALRRA